MFSLFCQSVRLLLTLHLCICFLCILFFITICIFCGKFSLSFVLGLFLPIFTIYPIQRSQLLSKRDHQGSQTFLTYRTGGEVPVFATVGTYLWQGVVRK